MNDGLDFAPGESLPLTVVTIVEIRRIRRILSDIGSVTIMCDRARYGSPDELTGEPNPVHTLHLVAQRPQSRMAAVEVTFDIPSLAVRINSDVDWDARCVAATVMQYLERQATTYSSMANGPVFASIIVVLSVVSILCPMLVGLKPTAITGGINALLIWLLVARLPAWVMPTRGVYLSDRYPRAALVNLLGSVMYKIAIPVVAGVIQAMFLALLRRP